MPTVIRTTRRLVFALLAVALAAATPAGAQRAQRAFGTGRLGVGPFVGSGPGAAPMGPQVPTVGVVGDFALARLGPVGLHVGGTYEHRAGARMTGAVASAVLPLPGRLALRVGAAAGGADVQRQPWARQLGWRDWRGVDAGLELRFRRTTGALMVRSGTLDTFAIGCPPEADCLVAPGPAQARRFTRISVESRFTLF